MDFSLSGHSLTSLITPVPSYLSKSFHLILPSHLQHFMQNPQIKCTGVLSHPKDLHVLGGLFIFHLQTSPHRRTDSHDIHTYNLHGGVSNHTNPCIVHIPYNHIFTSIVKNDSIAPIVVTFCRHPFSHSSLAIWRAVDPIFDSKSTDNVPGFSST